MKAHEVLRAAHTAISEGGWSVGTSARDQNGRQVALWSHTAGGTARINPLARKFSVYGAVCKAAQGRVQDNPTMMWSVLAQCAMDADETVPGGSNHLHPILGFNEREGRTQEEVLALLLRAALICESGEVKPPAPADAGLPALTRDIEVVDAAGNVLGSGPIGGSMTWTRQPGEGEEVLTRFKGGPTP